MTLRAVFGGVSNVLVGDGTDTLLVDGYFSRPSLLRLLGRVRQEILRLTHSLTVRRQLAP